VFKKIVIFCQIIFFSSVLFNMQKSNKFLLPLLKKFDAVQFISNLFLTCFSNEIHKENPMHIILIQNHMLFTLLDVQVVRLGLKKELDQVEKYPSPLKEFFDLKNLINKFIKNFSSYNELFNISHNKEPNIDKACSLNQVIEAFASSFVMKKVLEGGSLYSFGFAEWLIFLVDNVDLIDENMSLNLKNFLRKKIED
jgi:hypothetical protein